MFYANALPEPSQYDAYYRLLSKYDVISTASTIPDVDQFRAQSAIQFCHAYLRPDAVIADLGCGSGVLLNAFHQAGYHTLYGLDPAPNAHNKAQELFSLAGVTTGTLEQAAEKLPLAALDLVCLMGVLEHLPLVREDLTHLISSLTDDAMIMIEVPALERFESQDFEPYGEFSLEHIHYFSAKTLTQLMLSLGYSVLDISYLPLPQGSTDSLLCLFGKQSKTPLFSDEVANINSYLKRSKDRMDRAMQYVLECESEQFIIYGAGSHSARLIPELLVAGYSEKLVCLVDANINLQGKNMGGLMIKSPRNWLFIQGRQL
ncbi:MAG: class I SAM-dependent methyltransferase [Gammaproteobacteria bacterium]|nr:class I SAM-dependent methyltransferase [Gammaproteobacteria bacterium]